MPNRPKPAQITDSISLKEPTKPQEFIRGTLRACWVGELCVHCICMKHLLLASSFQAYIPKWNAWHSRSHHFIKKSIYLLIYTNKSAIYLAGFIGWTRLFCIVPFPWFHRCVYILALVSTYIITTYIVGQIIGICILRTALDFAQITNHQRRYHKRFLILILIMCFPFSFETPGRKKVRRVGIPSEHPNEPH